MILLALLAGQALQVAAADTPASPELKAAQDYAHCIGLTAVAGSARIPSVDEAVRLAFEQCSAKRATALAAITTAFKAGGLDEDRASQEAEETLRDNDLRMANKLKTDITAYRQTGQLPDAPSHH